MPSLCPICYSDEDCDCYKKDNSLIKVEETKIKLIICPKCLSINEEFGECINCGFPNTIEIEFDEKPKGESHHPRCLPFKINEIDPDKYQELIDKTWVKPEVDSEELLKALMGLTCESVEALNLFNRWRFKKKKFDKKELIDELGDVWYYLLKSLHLLGITVEDISKLNREKLSGGKHGWAEKSKPGFGPGFGNPAWCDAEFRCNHPPARIYCTNCDFYEERSKEEEKNAREK